VHKCPMSAFGVADDDLPEEGEVGQESNSSTRGSSSSWGGALADPVAVSIAAMQHLEASEAVGGAANPPSSQGGTARQAQLVMPSDEELAAAGPVRLVRGDETDGVEEGEDAWGDEDLAEDVTRRAVTDILPADSSLTVSDS
jgi:hypothetical protein